MEDVLAEIVANTLLNGWLSHFGVPNFITSDQGRQFESQLFKELTRCLGSHHVHTTAFHPAANGMVERLHRQLKSAIRCHETENWVEILPLVLPGIRSTYKDDIQATPAEMVYGSSLKLQREFFTSDREQTVSSDFVTQLKRNMQNIRPRPASRHGSSNTFIHKDLKTASHVFLRQDATKRSLQPLYDGPYKVIRRSDKHFTIIIGSQERTVSID
ncbi:uncharacterized protein LOC143175236 [Nomia melanderi]|uniref:uncharacterized protein LOC143175236 n=1 Tax=Nomia melanderi TaxID=2448451 RepID=UPI003FCDA70D